MSSRSGYDERNATEAPPQVRRWLLIALAIGIGGGAFLLAQRGDAIMIDLAALGRFFCL